MNAARNIDMAEATRLTRLGRLADAMAVLQGGAATEAPSASPSPHSAAASSSVIDLQPPAKPGGVWTTLLDSAPRRPTSPPHSVSSKVHALWDGPVRTGVATPPIPAGARFDDAVFAGPEGRCAYKLYVPSGYDGQQLPLVVMLHGCTQSPQDFAVGTGMNALAEEQLFLVAYPAQPSSANASKCWNWFQSNHQKRGQGEPALIAGITLQVMRDFSVDASRVYIAGLSAGGAAAAIMGSAYPDLYAAIGVHSGLACGAAKDMPSAFMAMSQGGPASAHRGSSTATLPTIVFHGDADHTVNPANADQVIMQSKASALLRTSVTSGASAGGVAYQRTVHADELGVPQLEQWIVHGAGHAWSGGSPAGSYTDPRGPDASGEMMRFFLQHHLPRRG